MVTSPRQVVIADTSVLMYLHLLGLTHVLRELYGRVLVPEAVVAELEQGRREGHHDLPDPGTISWMDVRRTPPAEDLTSRFPGLDPGEVAVLALAVSQTDEVTLLLDDREAREAAGILGFEHPGVLGILLAAKEAGIVPTVRPYVERLQRLGFRATPSLFSDVLAMAGEQTSEPEG